MLHKILALIIIIFFTSSSLQCANANDFSSERYLGWYWFEEKAPVVPSKDDSNNESQAEITSLQAKAEIEQLVKDPSGRFKVRNNGMDANRLV